MVTPALTFSAYRIDGSVILGSVIEAALRNNSSDAYTFSVWLIYIHTLTISVNNESFFRSLVSMIPLLENPALKLPFCHVKDPDMLTLYTAARFTRLEMYMFITEEALQSRRECYTDLRGLRVRSMPSSS